MTTKVKTETIPTKIEQFTHHRNGVGGRPFFAFLVTHQYVCHDGSVEEPASYIVTWFYPEGYGEKSKGEKRWDPGEEVAFLKLDGIGRPDPTDTYRGDRLIWAIQDELKKEYLKRYNLE